MHFEDNLADAELIRNEIEKSLPNASINHVSSKNTFYSELENSNYDLIIADYNVPGISVKESLDITKNYSRKRPFIYVSEEIGEEGAVDLLRSGATDYVLKYRLNKLPIAITRAIRELDDKMLVDQNEAKVNQLNEFRASVLNALSAHIAVLDEKGNIVETNLVWDNYVKRQADRNLQSIPRGSNYLEELLKIDDSSNDEIKLIHENIFKVINGQYKYYYHDYSIKHLQQEKWYTMRVTPRIDGKGVVIAHSNITDLIVSEKRLRESELKFRGIFEQMSEGILHIDENGKIESVNPGLCRMLEYTSEELVGMNCYKYLHDEATAKRLQKKMTYRRKGNVGQYEAQFKTKSGRKIWAKISSQPNYNANGEFIGVMSLIMDITEQKNADLEAMRIKESFTKELEQKVMERTRELEKTQKELAMALEKEKQLGELKSRFVSTASHQFRTPLSVIQNYMGILSMQKDLMGEKFIPVFDKSNQRIKGQIERMTELMNDVLILGKINAGNISVRIKETDLVHLCNEIVKSHSEITSNKKLEMNVIGQPYLLDMDPKLFEHALSNFLSNALKYSPENSTSKLTLNFNENELQISVKDNGIGIPEDELPHLFDPFYRATNAKDVSGTGLGTAIAKEYLELIGGEVTVISELNVGTEILITFKKEKDGNNFDRRRRIEH